MRLLVICISLGILLWQTSLNNPPNILTLIGFMIATGLTLTRFCKRFGLPALSGALIGGLLLGTLHIIPTDALALTDHLNDFAWGWTGLFLGAGLTPKILCNTRLYKGALCLFFPPAIATFAFFVLQDTPMNTAIPLALIAGTSVILFLPPNSKINGEIIPLGQLTTGLGFLFWIIFTIDLTTIWQTETVLVKLLDIALFGVLLEAVVQICKHVKTEIAQHLTLISLAYVLAIATVDRDISPFILAFPSGIFLSIRNVHAPLLRTPSLSDAILSFVLISLALDVSLKSPFIGTYAHTITLGFYFIVLIVGKVAGGILAQRLLGFPPKVWFALIPQGLVALFCLHQTPNTIFSSQQGSLHTFVLLSFTALSVLYPISITLWSNIKRDPLVGHRPS